MIAKSRTLYYCEHCLGRKCHRAFTVKRMMRHELICFGNPQRVPQPGEITTEWMAQSLPDPVPAWWPGKPGMIYTGARWLDVPGYAPHDPDPEAMWRGETWPIADGKRLDKVRPWARRLVLAIDPADLTCEEWEGVEKYANEGER